MYDAFFQQPSNLLLKKAISESIAPLTIVIGSGLSKPAGLPDWKDLRKAFQLQLDNQYTSKTSVDRTFSDPRYKKASLTTNYWEFFQLSKDILGQATFNGIVRNALEAPEGEIPEGYRKLFELTPRGVVTLNLDTIAGQAFAQYSPRSVIPIYGFEIAKKWQIINDEKPFLVYIHGHLHDHETWVLTQSELDKLLHTDGHALFLSQIYLNHTVLFVGLSADDIAISSALLRLKRGGFSAPRLFWLTTRMDAASDGWAKENDVQKIQYKASNEAEHLRFIEAFVDDIKKFNSRDTARIPPQISSTRVFGQKEAIELAPREIATLESEEVRKALSDILTKNLQGLTGDALYDAFDAFSKTYKYPIQTKAFYKDSSPPDNVFFGYEINFPELGSGNFGEVYQAKSPSGNIVCLKIMHSNIVGNREMIGGFRRGVRSMQILTNNNIDGVVPIIEAFEMPPTIVMNIVPGNSLQELFSIVNEIPWKVKVEIVTEIGKIVDHCHKLPEMVLHRDIKPSNIMLKDLDYSTYEYGELFVLDFDMSWHKNSSEKDIIFESRDDFGYLAPEQTDPARRVSTRSTKVDSYGLAMTAFALFGGLHPMAGWTMSADWEQRVRSTVKIGYKSGWKSLCNRVSRAIVDASAVSQEDRLEFSSFWRRLEKIVHPSYGETEGQPLDLIAEEILSIVADGREYKWDDIADRGSLRFPGGAKLEIEVDSNQSHLLIGIRYVDQGSMAYKSRKLSLGQSKDDMDAFCKRYDSVVKRANITHGMLDYVISLKSKHSLEFARDIAKELLIPLERLLKIQ